MKKKTGQVSTLEVGANGYELVYSAYRERLEAADPSAMKTINGISIPSGKIEGT